MFGCNSPRSAAVSIVRPYAVRGEHVVHEPADVVDVPRILRRHPRHAGLLGELDQLGGEGRFVSAGVVELHFYR